MHERAEDVLSALGRELAQHLCELDVVDAHANRRLREERVALEPELEAHVLDRVQRQHLPLSAP